jgi:hypothetical protein
MVGRDQLFRFGLLVGLLDTLSFGRYISFHLADALTFE